MRWPGLAWLFRRELLMWAMCRLLDIFIVIITIILLRRVLLITFLFLFLVIILIIWVVWLGWTIRFTFLLHWRFLKTLRVVRAIDGTLTAFILFWYSLLRCFTRHTILRFILISFKYLIHIINISLFDHLIRLHWHTLYWSLLVFILLHEIVLWGLIVARNVNTLLNLHFLSRIFR